MPLDPQVSLFLAAFQRAAPPPIWEQSLAEARAAVQPVPGTPEAVGSVREEFAAGSGGPVPLRVYTPAGTPRGVCLFLHGGGWVTGNLDTHDALARRLCRESGARVVAVDYRLAPEHPFPAAVDDAYAALLWAAERYPNEPRGVCGDSAGGNLAAAVCLMSRDRHGPAVAGQTLVYPITDCGCETESYRRCADGYFLTAESMRWFWRQYAPHAEQKSDPYASPLRAESLAGLPPALLVTAEFDVLRDEGRAYAERLASSGIPTEHIDCAGMIHAFVRRLHEFDRAGEVCARIGAFLRQRFAAH